MRRRGFLIEAGKAFAVVPGAVYLVGCGGSVNGSMDVRAVVATSSTAEGHSHQCTIPASDMQHPTNASYNTTAELGHQHMVVLSLAELTTLSLGGSVRATSTISAGHRHDFTFVSVH